LEKFEGNILALDLATSTGWACGPAAASENAIPAWGTLDLTGGKKVTEVEERYLALDRGVTGLIEHFKPEIVVYERPSPNLFHGKTTRLIIEFLCSLGGVAACAAWRAGVRKIRTLEIKETRMHFIGANPKRQIAKQMVVEKCHRMGWMVDNDDEGDACAVYSKMRTIVDPENAVAVNELMIASKRRKNYGQAQT